MPYVDPETRRKAKAESARRRRRRQKRLAGVDPVGPDVLEPDEPIAFGPLLPRSARLRTASDALALLERSVRLIDRDRWASGCEKARAVAIVAGAFLRAIDAGEMEHRIDALEAQANRHLRAVS